MDLLARREHSACELTDKLVRRFSSRDNPITESTRALIDEQLKLLAEENLQSDERFVESFINGRKAQGKGPLRIRQELEQKRVQSYLIEQYLDDESSQWLLIAEQVYHKKFGSKQPDSYQEKARRMRFMHYRGFPPSLIQSLL